MKLEFGKGEGSNLVVALGRAGLDQMIAESKEWLKGLTNEEANRLIEEAEEMGRSADTSEKRAIGFLAAVMMVELVSQIREELESGDG